MRNHQGEMAELLHSESAVSAIVCLFYRSILGRPAEDGELRSKLEQVLQADDRLAASVAVMRDMLGSDEYRKSVQPHAITTQEFLFPSRLQITPTPAKRLLLVGSCMTTEFSLRLSQISGGVDHDFILFNNAADLPDDLPIPPSEYTAQLLQIPLRSILTDRIIQFKDFRDRFQQEELIDYALTTIDVMLESGLKYQRSHNIPAFVTNFIIPFTPIAASVKEEGTRSDIASIIRRLNEHLARRVAALKNVYLLDLDALAGALGKDAILDDWFHIYSHNTTFFNDWTEMPDDPLFFSSQRLRVGDFRPSRMLEFFQLIWRAMDAKIRVLGQVDQVKMVVFDLDNTLWRGQIAEHYRDGMTPPLSVAWPEGLPEAIHHLRSRGILVAVCSKNDEEIVRERWDRAIPYGWLKLEDFVVVKINWKPKAVNIAEMLDETSLTPKSVVFIDDSPVERDAVATAFPNMRVIGDNPYFTRSILLRAPETQVAVLTHESARREGMIRKQIEREHERAIMSRDAFLHGLNCSVRADIIADVNHPRFARALELINKTNQFNTTGQRWSGNEIRSLFRGAGALIVLDVADKFTDYGLVGVVILRGALIEQFVMSCRVLGLDIERAALSVAVERARAHGHGAVRALVKTTKENRVSQDVYLKAGFSQVGNDYVYDSANLVCPDHIVLTVEG
jgi:FkbH-like protein